MSIESVSPWVSNISIPGISAIFVGKSGLSTSMIIAVESTSAPLVVLPDATRLYFPGAVLAGTLTENWAGSAVAMLKPRGPCPVKSMLVNAEGVGDETVTGTICPGLITMPLGGEEICRTGGLCEAAPADVSARNTVKTPDNMLPLLKGYRTFR